MKCDDLIDAIGEIDIESVEDTPKKRKEKEYKPESPAFTRILKWSTAAAAAVAVFLIAAIAINVIGQFLSPSQAIENDSLHEGRSGYGIVFGSNRGELEISDMKITFDIPTLESNHIPSMVTTDYKIKNLTDHTVTEKMLLNLGCDISYWPIKPDDSKNNYDYADMYSFSVDGVPLKEKIYIRNYNDDYYYGRLSQSGNIVMRQEYDLDHDTCLADSRLKYELISTDDYSYLSDHDDEIPYAPDTPVYVYTLKVINNAYGESWERGYFSAVKVLFPDAIEKSNVRLLGISEENYGIPYSHKWYSKITEPENTDGQSPFGVTTRFEKFKLYIIGGELDTSVYLLEPIEYEGTHYNADFHMETADVETITYGEYDRMLHTDAENKAIDELLKSREKARKKTTEAYENDSSTVEYWYVYEITLEPGETVSASSTVPACGRMDYYYDPPLYHFDYYALDYSGFPLNYIANDAFGPYEVTVNTDCYVYDTSGGIAPIEKTDGSYSFTAGGGFDGDYLVELCRFAVCESKELKQAQKNQSKRIALNDQIRFYIIFLSVILLIILVNVILIFKNGKDKSIGT